MASPLSDSSSSLEAVTTNEWSALSAHLEQTQLNVLDGESISIAALVAVSRFGVSAGFKNFEKVKARMEASEKGLQALLKEGKPIYGVTTGFGGSANTRTNDTSDLQRGLMQMQQCAILPVDKHQGTDSFPSIFDNALNNADLFSSTSMPEAWVRGAMLVRCNSLARGHSAVRVELITRILAFLNNDLIPLVPLRGSISASGDLCPLSYIGGVLEGNPDLYVWSGPRNKSGHRALISSDKALHLLGLEPIRFGPKEGLGLVNGTAMSTAAGALALHDAMQLAVVAQILTAMNLESMAGNTGNYASFIADCRDHPGQVEVAANIRRFLRGCRLSHGQHDSEPDVLELIQDRYPLRTAPQWLGPYLEVLSLAQQQITKEINSTTDNPLIEVTPQGPRCHNGGNFQATSMTLAMDNTRVALQNFGKLIFSQTTQLIDPNFNNGLPPNLTADEPSVSYTMKGLDINAAAYTSELGFLAQPVGPHVQNAEMGNQAVNSLALLSARYTNTAVEVFQMLCATNLYLNCQALDLRAMNLQFLKDVEPAMHHLSREHFAAYFSELQMVALSKDIWREIFLQLKKTVGLDSGNRFETVVTNTQPIILKHVHRAYKIQQSSLQITQAGASPQNATNAIYSWTEQTSKVAESIFCTNRIQYFQNPDASDVLGKGSKKMYQFVRRTLGIPFHRGLIDHPSPTSNVQSTTHPIIEQLNDNMTNGVKPNGIQMSGKSTPQEPLTTGTHVSKIYESLRSGLLYSVVAECLREPDNHY
ncbi:MAG: hypothetical protein M1814_004629 [Vezdaea aestivalis]|nr:MAG: hypothetical protein M1814_004629 [Vezdaea aestivalis]